MVKFQNTVCKHYRLMLCFLHSVLLVTVIWFCVALKDFAVFIY